MRSRFLRGAAAFLRDARVPLDKNNASERSFRRIGYLEGLFGSGSSSRRHSRCRATAALRAARAGGTFFAAWPLSWVSALARVAAVRAAAAPAPVAACYRRRGEEAAGR